MRYLPIDILEKIKQSVVQKLLRDKTFCRWRTQRIRYCIAVDATGIHTFKTEPYPNCCYKDSKKGIRTYSSSVMEAKLLCPNSFSISIMTECIINDPDNTRNNKQDCGQKAFIRLSKNLKAAYPQLAICILGDRFYPNDSIFKIGNSNKWDFIFTFKDGNLSTVREQITCEKQDNQTTEFEYVGTEKAKVTHYNDFYVNNLIYKNHKLHVIENKVKTVEKEPCRFVHITNVEINNDNFKEISQTGRLRWKIENEGFNDQKNGGYNLSHKFSRKSHKTLCNYYQCMQITHIIRQLNTLSLEYKKRLNKNANEYRKSLLEFTIGAVFHADFDTNEIELILGKIASSDSRKAGKLSLQHNRQKRKTALKIDENKKFKKYNLVIMKLFLIR